MLDEVLMTATTWQNRIIGEGEESPDQLLANPANWRVHPKHQQDALAGVLNEVGWVQRVIVNQRTGHIVDGHLRVSLALQRNEPTIPVVYVDLDEAEEALVLATLDPLSALATTDAGKLDELLRDISTGEAAVQEMLAELAERSGIVPTDDALWSDAFDALPDGDKSPFEQMTFTVHTRQAEIIRDAITKAKAQGPFDDTGNENSNGNALARICESYVG
jgi:hypothetical protein